MTRDRTENEKRYYDSLKRITLYQSPERLRRDSEKDWGLPYEEALEYAYENVIEEARKAIKGRRRPRGDGQNPLRAETPVRHETTDHPA